MSTRRLLSSLEVARESLRTGKVEIEAMPQRTKGIRARADERRKAYLAAPDDRRMQDAIDNPSESFTYGAGGMEFTVSVHERKRWYVEGDVDGVSVMVRRDGGYDHFNVCFDDLPPTVRAIAKDIRVALTHGETAADKARAKRQAAASAKHAEWMRRTAPEWHNADGTFSNEKMLAAMDKEQAAMDAAMADYDKANAARRAS